MTPRNFCSLLKKYEEYQEMKNGGSKNKKEPAQSAPGYIDKIEGW